MACVLAGTTAGVAALLAVAASLWLARAQRFDLDSWLRQAPAGAVHLLGRETGAGGCQIRRFVVEVEGGGVPALLRLPASSPGPFPALVILGGLGTGSQAVDLVDPSLPLVVAGLDYAYRAPEPMGALGLVRRLPEAWWGLLYTAAACRDLTRHVAALPEVDAGQVYLLGASLGAPLATCVAASERPAGLILLYGFSDHATLIDKRLQPYVRSGYLRRQLAHWGADLTRPFDAARALPRLCGTPVLVVYSSADDDLPAACSAALWSATCEPRERVDLPGGHIRPRQDLVLDATSEAVLGWLRRRRAWRRRQLRDPPAPAQRARS